MLMQTAAEAVKSGGIAASNNFSIAVSGKAFDVLSRQLYRRPIMAIVREVSCNAADAHTMVNKPQHTFEIGVPSMLSPQFTVKDFGPGLGEADIMHLYTTYFASTKDKSNDMIGGFGLGCKSPFAVSDQFTVISRFNGEATTYICIRIDGMPTVNKAGSVSCGDDTGITVIVPTKPADLREWRNSIAEFFADWPAKPFRIGTGKPLDPADLEWGEAAPPDMQSNNIVVGTAFPEWQYWPQPSRITNTKLYVRMGLVKYAISVPLGGATQKLQQVNGSITLTVPMGAIDVAPSREEVDYTDKTKAVIEDAANRMIAEVGDRVSDTLKNCASLYEARQFIYGAEADNSIKGSKSIRDFIKAGFLSLKAPTWNGKPVEKTPKFSIAIKPSETVDTIKGYGYEIVRHRQRSYTNAGRMHLEYSGGAAAPADKWAFTDYDLSGYYTGRYVWSDRTPSSSTVAKLKHNADEFKSGYGNAQVTVIKSPDFDALAKLFDEHGFAPLLKLSDLDDPPKTASQVTRSTTKTKGYIYTPSGWDNTEKDIDLTVPGYWAELFNGSPVEIAARQWNLGKSRAIGLLDKTKPVIGFAQRKVGPKLTKLLDTKGWIKLNPTTLSVAADSELKAAARAINFGISGKRLNMWSGLNGLQNCAVFGPMKKADLSKYPKALANALEYEVRGKPTEVWSEIDASKIVENLGYVVQPNFEAHSKAAAQEFDQMVSEFHKFLDAHPMLRYINADIPADQVLNYINRKI